MSSLSVAEFRDYCQQNMLNNFIVDSSMQKNLRFNLMRVRLEFNKVIVIPQRGMIAFVNNNSCYEIHCVSDVIIREKIDNIITIFDIVCDSDVNDIHTVLAGRKEK